PSPPLLVRVLPPPSSTLFPYTTLFRSDRWFTATHGSALPRGPGGFPRYPRLRRLRHHRGLGRRPHRPRRPRLRTAPGRHRHRRRPHARRPHAPARPPPGLAGRRRSDRRPRTGRPPHPRTTSRPRRPASRPCPRHHPRRPVRRRLHPRPGRPPRRPPRHHPLGPHRPLPSTSPPCPRHPRRPVHRGRQHLDSGRHRRRHRPLPPPDPARPRIRGRRHHRPVDGHGPLPHRHPGAVHRTPHAPHRPRRRHPRRRPRARPAPPARTAHGRRPGRPRRHVPAHLRPPLHRGHRHDPAALAPRPAHRRGPAPPGTHRPPHARGRPPVRLRQRGHDAPALRIAPRHQPPGLPSGLQHGRPGISTRRQQSDRPVSGIHGRPGHAPRPFRTIPQHPLHIAGIRAQLLVPELHRPQHLDHGLRGVPLQIPVRLVYTAQRLRVPTRARREDLQQIRHPRPGLPVVHDVPPAVRHRPHDLPAHHVGLVQHIDDPRPGIVALAHLRPRILKVHDPRRHLRMRRPRHHERLPVALVEPHRQVPGQLHVLRLVVPHRHLVRPVRQDVRRHHHGVRQQRQPHTPTPALLPRRLLPVLDHPAHLAVRGHALQQVRQPGVLVDVALHEHRAHLWIQPGRQQQRRRLPAQPAHPCRIVVDGQRVQIDDAEQRVRPVLVLRGPLPHGAQVVPERQVPGRLDPTDAPLHLSSPSPGQGRRLRPAAPRSSGGRNKNGRRSGGRVRIRKDGRRQAAHQNWRYVRVVMHRRIRPGGGTSRRFDTPRTDP